MKNSDKTSSTYMLIRLPIMFIGMGILTLIFKNPTSLLILCGWFVCWIFSFFEVRELEKKIERLERRLK
jgi:hypothetical protein